MCAWTPTPLHHTTVTCPAARSPDVDLSEAARYKTAVPRLRTDSAPGGSMDDADPEITYRHLLDLWTAGVRDYHSLLSDYLTANSIFVAAIGLLLTRQPLALIFTLLVIVLCL